MYFIYTYYLSSNIFVLSPLISFSEQTGVNISGGGSDSCRAMIWVIVAVVVEVLVSVAVVFEVVVPINYHLFTRGIYFSLQEFNMICM